MQHKFRINQLINGNNEKLQQTRVLIVGVGGIGCEVLKVVAKTPLGSIHILDMDTIELSNLNRQFLFKQEHKGHSKALVARQSILALFPGLDIHAHHCNIRDLPLNFFRQFNFIVLALDNVDARNYVNKIGVRLGLPIVDAGTLAYSGNATTILPGDSRCYACQPKSAAQTVFPVCTIRMRPEKPIHCVVWAKLLFSALYSGQTDHNDLSDLAELAHSSDSLTIVRWLFQTEIQNIRNAKADSQTNLNQAFLKSVKTLPDSVLTNELHRKILDGFRNHQKKLDLEDYVLEFVEALEKLKQRKKEEGSVPFQKDDDDVIHFITGAANLRMYCFSISGLSFNETKNMAGNIIPAIASTNAIVAGLEVLEMIKYLKGKRHQMKSYFVQNQNFKVLAVRLEKPLESCTVCAPKNHPALFECDFKTTKLSQFIQQLNSHTNIQSYSLNLGSTEIYNSDDPRETLLAKTLFEIGDAYELEFILTDEDTSSMVCRIWTVHTEGDTLKITGGEKLISSEKIEVEEKNELHEAARGGDDSDVVEIDESPEIQIVEVRKRGASCEPMKDENQGNRKRLKRE